MALAHICKCGHQKTDHYHSARKGIRKTEYCLWDGCECDTFNQDMIKTSNWRNLGRGINTKSYEPLFDMNQKIPPWPEYITKKSENELLVKDCDGLGFAKRPFREKQSPFNHGEYP